MDTNEIKIEISVHDLAILVTDNERMGIELDEMEVELSETKSRLESLQKQYDEYRSAQM